MQINFTNFVNDASTLYITLAFVALTTVYYFLKTRSLPPGPIGLPYLGFWPFWNRDACHMHLHELGKKYGDVFSFTITGRLYINLGSFKVIKEAFVTKSDYFAGKPSCFNMVAVAFEDGLVLLEGQRWKVMRKFFSQQFRERGLNVFKNDMCGGSMYQSIKDTIRELRWSKGEPVEITNMLLDRCTKVLYTTFFGERGITMKEIRDLNETYGNTLGDITGTNILLIGSIAKYLICPFMPSYWRGKKHFDGLRKQLFEIVDRHKATYDESNIRNVIDAYYQEKKDKQFKKDPTADYYTDKILVSSLVQIIGDGVVAVAALVSTFIQVLLERPEEQEKIYRELIEVIGTDRDPTMEDKSKLPYTNAFITEVLRTCDAFPFFPKLECTREVYIGGYRIPKGAMTVMNIWSAHYDPNEYEEPERFNPSRFLPSEGKRKLEQPVLYGMGKRACLGEGFTMSQVFLFLTTIVKNFYLSKPKNLNEGTLLFLVGKVHVCAHPRSEKTDID